MAFDESVVIEMGIWYSHEQKPIKHFREFVYTWYNIPTKKIGYRHIFVRRKEHLITLLNHWNRTDSWKYWINCCEEE